MTKKIMAGIGAVTTVAVLATALVASAQTAVPTVTTNPSAHPTASEQNILQVGSMGKVLMRGTIVSVSAGSLTVNSWGGTWIVNVGSGAQVLPAAAGNDLTQFKTGDFVGVQGTVSASANWTIDAMLVRDWTYRAAVVQQQKQNIQTAKGIMGSGPRNYVGTASNVNGSTFTLTVNGTADTVNVAPNAEVVEFNWGHMSLASINTGDNVHVWGVNASGTITAQIVRDVTRPATSTTQ